MTTVEDIWKRLSSSKKYREEFALALLKRSVSFQVKTLRKKRCGSQAVLAERAKLTQGVVSRAEDQDYGNLTFNTVGRIAAGLDMAFIGRFVPFGALVKYSTELSEAELEHIPTFEEESVREQTKSVPHRLRRLHVRRRRRRLKKIFTGSTVGSEVSNVISISRYLRSREGERAVQLDPNLTHSYQEGATDYLLRQQIGA
jgi:transcriptional regulator with XRE-family HTH domain